MSDLHELVESVSDRESFLVFVEALEQDRRRKGRRLGGQYGPDGYGWQNSTLEDFLEAAVAWTRDSIGLPIELPPEPSWRSFARFLYMGKIYE